MKKFFLIFFFSLLLIIPVAVMAQDTKVSVLKQNQTIDHVYFASGDTVNLDGTVNNDAYLAGGTVNVSGTVNGDLIAAGGTVNILGTVEEDLRVGGGTVNLSGVVNGNVTVGGGTVNIAKDTKINGTLIAGAGTLNSNGAIKDDFFLGAGTAFLNSPVGGSVQAGVGDLSIGGDSKVAGNITYTSENAATVAQTSQVGGTVNFKKAESPNPRENNKTQPSGAGPFIFGKLVSLAIMFLIGLAFIRYFPVFTQHVVTSVKNKKSKNILSGFLILVGTPFVILLLTITLIGIPFAAILLFSYFLLFYISKLFVAMYLGEVIVGKFSKSTSKSLALLTGLFAHLFLTIIPVLGWLIGAIIMVWGAGAFVSTKRATYKSLRAKKLI